MSNQTDQIRGLRRRWPARATCGRNACRVSVAAFSLLLLTSCGRAPQSANAASSAANWHEFGGTWTAVGKRTQMRLGADRQAAVSVFQGSLLLTGESRPGIGFRSDVIVFHDSATGMLGRAVWTDENGDQAYSELRGEGTAENNKITGTFVGGTGRYAGVTGEYEFSWRFLLENEDGAVQGQSMGLRGRVRVGSPQSASIAGGQR